jgi:patatin-related protein
VTDGTRSAQREIRLALVLNGGVSLAIWIGGVVAEIDRARRAGLDAAGDDDEAVGIYRQLLGLTGSLLRTDVIAGASAGGLNGCLLASAIVSGGAVDDVRDTWIELGSFTKLLRSGLKSEPESLLKGDEYFLPQVEAELARRLDVASARRDIEPEHCEAAADRRVELFVTGTNLTGQPVEHRDDFGGTLVDHEHRALFWFRHEPEVHASSFADPEAPRRLARVARSTASFPGAFEASFCRVDGTDPNLPSLSGIASFRRDAWVIDGGVLDNAPFRPALEAIRRAPASGPVQRVLCYVTPYATSPDERAARRSEPPALGSVVGAAFNLPRDVTLTETLEDVAEYKQRVRNRRASRGTVAARLGDTGLFAQARLFHDDYCAVRAATSADDVLRRFVAGSVGRRAQGAAHAVQRPVASGARLLDRGVTLPWIPGSPRGDDLEWAWGLAPIGRSSLLVLDLLARTLAITPGVSALGGDSALDRIVTARQQLSGVLGWVRLRREAYFAAAERRYAQLPTSAGELGRVLEEQNGGALDLVGMSAGELQDLARLVSVAASFRETVDADPSRPECRPQMERVAFALGDAGTAAMELLARPAAAEIAPGRRTQLLRELEALVGTGAGATDDQRLRRLLELEVIYESLVPSPRDHDQTLLFMRLNAEAPCELDPSRTAPEHKLSGLGLAHFASFYKRSWRANDWMWGRLDGASRLVDVLLDPWAIRLELDGAGAAERMTRRIAGIAGADDPQVGADIRAELEALAEWPLVNDPPTFLEHSRAAVRRRLQLLIARSELPAVASAARDDADRDGAAPDAAALGWAATAPDPAATDTDVERGLRRLPLPQGESLTTEIGSNLLTRNVATVAAVSAAALAGPHSGVPRPLRLVPRALRGLFLPFYGLTWGLTAKRPAWRVATLLAVLLAVAVVAWGLLAEVDARDAADGVSSGNGALASPPGWLHALALGVLVAALALGVLRGGWAGLVVAAVFALVYLALVLTPVPDDAGDVAGRLWRSEPVLVAAVALLAAGIVASVVARPLHIVSRLWRTRRALLVAGSVAAAGLVAALAVWLLA